MNGDSVRKRATGRPSLEALFYEAEKQGILPLTSVCGVSCIFCSNRYNPPKSEIISIPPRSLEDIEGALLFLEASSGPIVIGESVTRINEGEPLSHPDFEKIIGMVRKALPERQIKVTTNGVFLTQKLIDALEDLGVSLTLSLNTVNCREKVMNDPDGQKTLDMVKKLGGRVSFEGSVVALPFITGWDDLKETVLFLLETGAQTVRVMAPSFSKFHPLFQKMPEDTWEKTRIFIDEEFPRSRYPVLFEPPKILDLKAEIEYVLPSTAAYRAGLWHGEIIQEVSGRPVFSREDAFQMTWQFQNPILKVSGEDGIREVKVLKDGRTSPGFVLFSDLSKEGWMDWEGRSGVRAGRDILILTSVGAKPVICAALKGRGLEAQVHPVRSVFYGGNIEAAGLLTVRDYLASYNSYLKKGQKVQMVTLPKRSFDPWGRDLEGVHWKVFEEKIGRPVLLGGT